MKSLSLRTLITFSVLSLGLTSFLPAQAVEVFFERDQKVPLVYVSVAFRAGATQDPEKLQGISQFTTELMLRGTKSRSRERLDLDLDQMGAHLAVEVRAEYLVFQGAVLSRELNGFLELLMEVLTQPAFSEGEIQKLKSELKSGLLDEQSKDARVAAKQFARLTAHKPVFLESRSPTFWHSTKKSYRVTTPWSLARATPSKSFLKNGRVSSAN